MLIDETLLAMQSESGAGVQSDPPASSSTASSSAYKPNLPRLKAVQVQEEEQAQIDQDKMITTVSPPLLSKAQAMLSTPYDKSLADEGEAESSQQRNNGGSGSAPISIPAPSSSGSVPHSSSHPPACVASPDFAAHERCGAHLTSAGLDRLLQERESRRQGADGRAADLSPLEHPSGRFDGEHSFASDQYLCYLARAHVPSPLHLYEC